MIHATCEAAAPAEELLSQGPGDGTETPIEHAWRRAFDQWQRQLPSPHTRRAYARAWRALAACAGKPAWELGAAEIRTWAASLSQPVRGAHGRAAFAPATVAQYLSAISSFYRFAGARRLLEDAAAAQRGLLDEDPLADFDRPRVDRYARSAYLQPDQARALLAAIPRDTLQGRRDYALLLLHLTSGKPSSAVCQLRWGDLQVTATGALIAWPDVPGEPQPFSPPTWNAIGDYLRATRRLEAMQPEDYLFLPRDDTALHLPTLEGAALPRNRPLSVRQVRGLLKRYARLAGLDAARTTLSSLRHTAVLLRCQVGDNPAAIGAFLADPQAARTRRYLRNLGQAQPIPWATVEELLGL